MSSYGVLFLVKIIQFCSRIYSKLPRSVHWGLGLVLYHFYWNLLKVRRFTVYRNLRIVFPNLSKPELIQMAQEAVKWMSYYFLRFFLIPSLRESDLKTKFRFHGLNFLEKARAKGRGVLLLSCHMGNPDMGLNGLALAGEKIWVISKKFSNSFFNELWFQLRSRPGVNYISPHGRETSYQIFKALASNESVLFVTDQFMSSPYGIESYFFGRKTGTAYGLARFFLKSKAPVVPCFTIEDESGVCHIYLEEPVWPCDDLIMLRQNETKDSHTLRLVELFNHRVESMILKAPKHWMWIHRRWKRWKP